MDQVVTDLISNNSKKKVDDKTFLSTLSESANNITESVSPAIKNMSIPDFKSLSKQVSKSIENIVPNVSMASPSADVSPDNADTLETLEIPTVKSETKKDEGLMDTIGKTLFSAKDNLEKTAKTAKATVSSVPTKYMDLVSKVDKATMLPNTSKTVVSDDSDKKNTIKNMTSLNSLGSPVTAVATAVAAKTASSAGLFSSPANYFDKSKTWFYISGLIIVSLLAYNFYLQYYENTDIISKHFGPGGKRLVESTKKTFETSVKGIQETPKLIMNKENVVEKKVIERSRKLDETKGINKALNKPSKPSTGNRRNRRKQKTYTADSHMESSIQASAKKGWCYIGTDRGYRSCVKSDSHKCMSGNIFPSKDICINPNLRYE